VIFVVLFVDVLVIVDADVIQSLQCTKILVSTHAVIVFKRIRFVVVIKAVKHAVISKTENFVWMKIVVQATKIMTMSVAVKIT